MNFNKLFIKIERFIILLFEIKSCDYFAIEIIDVYPLHRKATKRLPNRFIRLYYYFA